MSRTRTRPFGAIHRQWQEWGRRRQWKRVSKAVTLAPRGAIAHDSPRLCRMSLALELEWHARDVHPWDADLPGEQRAERFTAGLMADTITVTRQVFERLAGIDVIRIRVLAPNASNKTVLTGTVSREDLYAAQACPSPVMSLKILGLQYVPDGCS